MSELKDLSMTELLRMKGQLEQNYIGTWDKPASYYVQMSAINDAIKDKEKQNLPIDWAEEMEKCKKSPYYFMTKYMLVDGKPFTTILSEDEFNSTIKNLDKQLIKRRG